MESVTRLQPLLRRSSSLMWNPFRQLNAYPRRTDGTPGQTAKQCSAGESGFQIGASAASPLRLRPAMLYPASPVGRR